MLEREDYDHLEVLLSEMSLEEQLDLAVDLLSGYCEKAKYNFYYVLEGKEDKNNFCIGGRSGDSVLLGKIKALAITEAYSKE